MTDMLSELGLATFSDLFHDNVDKFKTRWLMASNDDIIQFHLHLSVGCSVDVFMYVFPIVLIAFISLLYCGLLSSSSSYIISLYIIYIYIYIYLYGPSCLN